MAPRGAFLKRSDAMSSQAQAHAEAAVPKRQVRFAPEARVLQEGRPTLDVPVDFGPKAKPQRPGRPAPAPATKAPEPAPMTAPSPPPPESPARAEGKPSFFSGLLHRPGSGSPPRRAETGAASVPPHLSTKRTPGEKFTARLTQFMEHGPGSPLKTRLSEHAISGRMDDFKKELLAALGNHSAPDQKSFELMQGMLSSIHQMKGDYSDVRIRYAKPKG